MRGARWPFILALLLALCAAPAAACSLGSLPAYRIWCYGPDGRLQEHYGSWTYDDHPRAGESIGDFCPAAPAEARALFDTYVQRDIVSYDWRRSFTIEPYTVEREREVTQSREDYLQCHYLDFERNGDWLAVAPYRRSYCYEGICGEVYFSAVLFFPFLLLHLNGRMLPFLLPYLAFLMPLVALFIYLQQHGALRTFFRPTRGTLGWYVAPFLLCCAWFSFTGVMWSPADVFLGWLLFGYVFICLARALRQRQRSPDPAPSDDGEGGERT
jgi:hypothetical protein